MTLDIKGNKDIGLQLQGSVKEPFLLNGLSLATLQMSETFQS